MFLHLPFVGARDTRRRIDEAAGLDFVFVAVDVPHRGVSRGHKIKGLDRMPVQLLDRAGLVRRVRHAHTVGRQLRVPYQSLHILSLGYPGLGFELVSVDDFQCRFDFHGIVLLVAAAAVGDSLRAQPSLLSSGAPAYFRFNGYYPAIRGNPGHRPEKQGPMTTAQRKLGIIVPSWNTVMEYETQLMAGGTMSVHSMRIPHTADTEEKLLWLGTQAPAAARLRGRPDVAVSFFGSARGGIRA